MRDSYEIERDKLIPMAEAETNRIVGKTPSNGESKEAWGARWSRTFLAEMDRMAKQTKLTRPFREIAEAMYHEQRGHSHSHPVV